MNKQELLDLALSRMQQAKEQMNDWQHIHDHVYSTGKCPHPGATDEHKFCYFCGDFLNKSV